MTQCGIFAKYITELESIDFMVLGIVLIFCVATNIAYLFDKLSKYTQQDKPTIDDAYESFCQENREYVKNLQFIKMWHELGAEGQKEWVNKVEAFHKLFKCKIVFCKLHAGFRDEKHQCVEITGSYSAETWVKSEITRFKLFCKEEH